METSISMADFYEKYLNENLNLIEGLSDNIQWCQLKDDLTKGK